MRGLVWFLIISLMLVQSMKAIACASCGCNIDSDIEIKPDDAVVPSDTPWKFDLRYDYINQNQLRSGVNTISASSAGAMQSYTQEVEKYTVNKYITLAGQYDWSQWALRLIAPIIQRSHATNGNGVGDATWNGAEPDAGGGAYTSNITGLGDIRLIGVAKNVFGVSQLNFGLGVKLPTGGTHQTGTSIDETNPERVLVDPGLQLGTGTTDLIYSIDYTRSIAEKWSSFFQTQFQTSLQTVNNYRPGDSYNVNLGFRYFGFQGLTPSLQLNTRWVLTDSGSAADQISTGGTLVYITPGLAERWGESGAFYQLIQIPIYQFVDGVQVAPQYIVSVGIQYSI